MTPILGSDQYQNVKQGFATYCEQFRLSGKQFANMNRELLANWMNLNHFNVQRKDVYLMLHELKSKLEIYDDDIAKRIETTVKLNTQKYDVKYYRKLYHFFCISQRDYICFRSIHQIPDKLLHALLLDEKGAISMTECTNLFSNVQHIAFTWIPFQYLMSNVRRLCLSVVQYSRNIKANQYKRLKLVTLRSVDLPHSKYSVVLQNMIKQIQAKTSNVKLKYEFQFAINHVIEMRIDHEIQKHQDIEEDKLITKVMEEEQKSEDETIIYEESKDEIWKAMDEDQLNELIVDVLLDSTAEQMVIPMID